MLGVVQSKRTGKKIIDTIQKEMGEEVKEVIIYSSPYLRCLMTSAYLRKELTEAFPGLTSAISVNNMLCETMKKNDADANPLELIYLNNENHDEVDAFMAG